MEDNGDETNEFTYGVMIQAYCKENRSGEAVNLIEDMLGKDCVSGSELCCKVVDMLFEEWNVERACKVWRAVSRKDCSMDGFVVDSTLIHWLCKNGKELEARIMFDEFGKESVASLLMYNTLIAVLFEGGKLCKAAMGFCFQVECSKKSTRHVHPNKVSIRDIFWTHPKSIKLFNTFPTVLIINSNYKTNKYRLPPIEIVGVTSTDKTYSVGFAFLEFEKEDNVTWALDICKTLLKNPNNMPNVIITDRDNALMNAVTSVFPTSSVLLCRYHITKNVRSRLKPAVGTKEITDDDGKVVKPLVVVERIIDGWMNILNSSSEELYVENVVNFRKLCVKYPDFLKYVESTILDQVKEKVVCVWTDRLRHLGCTTTNRVEFAHASLKRWLGDSKGDLCREWDTVNQILANQHNEIQSTFDHSTTVIEHRYKNNFLYSHLVLNISRVGLNFIFHEAKRAETTGPDSSKCGCSIKRTYGLPCACVISKKMKHKAPIRMDEVYTHWQELRFDDFDVPKDNSSDINSVTELEVIMDRFSKANFSMK